MPLKWKSDFLKPCDRLECSDGSHIVHTCSTHEFYRLVTFQSNRTTLTLKNIGFPVSEMLERRWGEKSPKTTSDWKFNFSEPDDRLECSDGSHIAHTCSTHEFYRLVTFQNNRTTLTLKNIDFSVSEMLEEGGTKSHLENPTSEPYDRLRAWISIWLKTWNTSI